MSELCMPFFGGRLKVSPFAFMSLSLMFYIEGAKSFFIIMSAAILHELGHLAAVYIAGSRVVRIDVYAVGAVILYDTASVSYKKEAAIAFAGPAANIIFGLLSSVVFLRFRCVELLLFIFASAFFALFNLLPLRGNDGWNILRSLIAEKRGVVTAESAAGFIATAASVIGAVASLLLYFASGGSPAVVVLLLFCVMPT